MVDLKFDALFTESGEPATDQRGRLHFLRIDAAGSLLESFDSELAGPVTEIGWRERADDPGKVLGREARAGVAGDKGLDVFTVRQIQTAVPGDKKFSGHGALCLENGNTGTPCSTGFGSPQAGGAASDDCNLALFWHAGSLGG